MSGLNSAGAWAAYQRSRARLLEDGDCVLLHLNSYRGGFWTDVTRTFTLGAPDRRQQEVRAAILEAREAAIGAVRPGARATDVDRAARTVMERRGLREAFRHGTGHGLGFAAIVHHALPRLHPRSEDVLERGMVFNEGRFGMRQHDELALGSAAPTR